MLATDGKYNYDSDGLQFTADKDSTTTKDFKVTTDKTYVSGGEFLYDNAVWGDYITVEIIDKDDVLPSPATGMTKTHITKRFLHPNRDCEILNVAYAGKVPQNCYLRVKVVSVGTTNNLNCAVNFDLHKEV